MNKNTLNINYFYKEMKETHAALKCLLQNRNTNVIIYYLWHAIIILKKPMKQCTLENILINLAFLFVALPDAYEGT